MTENDIWTIRGPASFETSNVGRALLEMASAAESPPLEPEPE